jgi:hypothetical protein
MYTATLLGNTIDKQARRRIVTVKFSDGTSEFDKDFSFSVETEVPVMKRTVKQYLDELNFVPEDITGDITDYQEPVEEAPTQAELDKQAWQADRAKLATVMELVRDGVFDGTETQVTALQNKVKTGFKPAYLD